MKSPLREIEVNFTTSPKHSLPVGILAMQRNRLFFEYDTSWLQTGLELSPFILPGKPGLIEHKNREFGPLFGLFDDSLPDGWGLLLMDRYFRSQTNLTAPGIDEVCNCSEYTNHEDNSQECKRGVKNIGHHCS